MHCVFVRILARTLIKDLSKFLSSMIVISFYLLTLSKALARSRKTTKDFILSLAGIFSLLCSESFFLALCRKSLSLIRFVEVDLFD